MFISFWRRSPRRGLTSLHRGGALTLALLAAGWVRAQSPASAPASIPAGADLPAAASTTAAPVRLSIPHKQVREAESAYLQGVKDVEHRDSDAAEKNFERALQLNPANRDYALALIVTREHHVSQLVQQAAKARLLGNTAKANDLLAEARRIDPDSSVISQHFSALYPTETALPKVNPVTASLGGAIELAPSAAPKDVHLRGSAQDVLRSLYELFGIRAGFDPSVNISTPIRLDLDSVAFADAARAGASVTHTFAVPLDAHSALIAADTPENRERLQPQLEETVYMPGLASEQMTEMANVARNIFDLKSVTASTATDSIVLRGDEQSLKALNATYAGMLGGGSDVLLDIKLYEVDRTNTRNIGLQLPSSVGIFSVTAEASQLVASNQSIINQAIASGLIKLTGNSLTDLITEVGFLIASGTVSASQYTNLLGIFGNGLSLAGLYVGSGATFNLLLNSSDVRTLDAVQLRSTDRQAANFRAGTRYPIQTGIYSNNIASSLAGLNVNGTNVGSLLQQYLGTSNISVPQIQFEDLGLTVKATPQILHGGSVQLQLDMKIEALGGTSLNTIPILNSRQLTSTVTIPAGQSVLLVSEVSSDESLAVQGIPGLGELPGFRNTTNHSTQKDTGELLIAITPHIVREGDLHIVSQPLIVPHGTGGGGGMRPEPLTPAPAPIRPPATPSAPGTSPQPAPPGTPAPRTTGAPGG